MRAYLFPGQGAQFVGMGGDLFDRFSDLTAEADDILGYSVRELCLRDPRSELARTEFTQPAVFVVNALSDRQRRESGQARPDFVAGHSLGEYSALLAAGVFDFPTGLRLVKKRAELMSAAPPGGMAAVIGCGGEQTEELLREHALTDLDIANYNSPSQIVLSGPEAEIQRARPVFRAAGAKYLVLRVSGAFHSRLMEPLVEALGEALGAVRFSPPEIPVLSNVTGRPHDPEEVADRLRRQLREPVRWLGCVRFLLEAGVEDVEEVGPGRILTKLFGEIVAAGPTRPAGASGDSAPGDGASLPEQRRPVALAGRGQAGAEGYGEGAASSSVAPEDLGSRSFLAAYGVRRAYVAGSMYKGIASTELVSRMAKAGYLAFFGAGGLRPEVVEDAIVSIRDAVGDDRVFGVNLLAAPDDPSAESAIAELCLKHAVPAVEAAGFATLSPAVVRFRLQGLIRDSTGRPASRTRIIAKVSRPEVAEAFLSPPPAELVRKLVGEGLVSEEQARLAESMPMADDLCVEADSAGHTDRGVTAVLLPVMIRLRDRLQRGHGYETPVRVGSSGGIGTPEAAASAFFLGADFILTGSVNQCTVEAGISDAAKDILEAVEVHDTAYAPAGDMFELGAKIQVVKKGLFFPARARTLHDLWRFHDSWSEIAPATRSRIERLFFGRSFEEVYDETRRYFLDTRPAEIEKAESNEKHKMALVFRWYFIHTMRLALRGATDDRVNFQIHCGPALGAFNQWASGTELGSWRQRHVDAIADLLMEGAAEVIHDRLRR